jgi:hypothetical protein
MEVTMESAVKKHSNGAVDSYTRQEIFDAVSRISYGEVVLTIHDGKVVQIEKREKVRLK